MDSIYIKIGLKQVAIVEFGNLTEKLAEDL